MKRRLLTVCLVFLMCLTPIFAMSIPKQDKSIYVNDYANVFSDSTKKSLISLNESSDHSTGGYVVVATFDYVEGDINDYGYQIFNKWGIGDKDNDNGVLLILDIGNENCAWVIGTGLEDILTTKVCQNIINNYFKDDFLNKKYDSATINTTKQFLKYIDSGHFTVNDNASYNNVFAMDMMETVKIGAFVFLILIVGISVIVSPRSRRGYAPRRYYRSYRHYRPHRHEDSRPHYGHSSMMRPRTGRTSGPPRGGSMRGSNASRSHHSGGSSRGSGGSLK